MIVNVELIDPFGPYGTTPSRVTVDTTNIAAELTFFDKVGPSPAPGVPATIRIEKVRLKDPNSSCMVDLSVTSAQHSFAPLPTGAPVLVRFDSISGPARVTER